MAEQATAHEMPAPGTICWNELALRMSGCQEILPGLRGGSSPKQCGGDGYTEVPPRPPIGGMYQIPQSLATRFTLDAYVAVDTSMRLLSRRRVRRKGLRAPDRHPERRSFYRHHGPDRSHHLAHQAGWRLELDPGRSGG